MKEKKNGKKTIEYLKNRLGCYFVNGRLDDEYEKTEVKTWKQKQNQQQK
jgi:hypothetical protein